MGLGRNTKSAKWKREQRKIEKETNGQSQTDDIFLGNSPT